MPIATVQLPNGKIADIEVPQGATPQEIESFVMSQPEFAQQPSQQEQPNLPQESFQQAPIKSQSFQEQIKPYRRSIVDDAKTMIDAIYSGAENIGLGGYQAAADLGIRFEPAKRILSAIRPDLKEEIKSLTPQDISEAIASRISQKKVEEKDKSTLFKVTKAVTELVPFLTGGATTGAKVAAATGSKVAGLAAGGAVGGAEISALSPQEQAGLGNRAIETAKGAATGAAFGAGLGVGGKIAGLIGGGLKETAQAIKSGFKAKPIEELADIGSTIADNSRKLYKAVDESGLTFKPEAIKQLMGRMVSDASDGGTLFKTNHPKTIGLLREISKDIETKGNIITLSQLDGYRKALSTAAQDSINNIGKTTDDGRRLKNVIRSIDNFIDENPSKVLNIPEESSQNIINTYRDAQDQWKIYRKFSAVSNLIKKADGDPNRLKTLVKNFVDNESKISGFKTNEIDALRIASRNSNTEGFLKAIGKFGFDLGSGRNIGNTVVPGASILYGGPAGSLTATIGTAARQAQKLSAKGKVEDVLKLIQGQQPQIASKVIQKLPPKTRDYVITNLLTKTATQN